MNKFHSISNVHFENDHLIVTIDGVTRNYLVKHISRILQNASDTDILRSEDLPGYNEFVTRYNKYRVNPTRQRCNNSPAQARVLGGLGT
jgi:hypothetical protein